MAVEDAPGTPARQRTATPRRPSDEFPETRHSEYEGARRPRARRPSPPGREDMQPDVPPGAERDEEALPRRPLIPPLAEPAPPTSVPEQRSEEARPGIRPDVAEPAIVFSPSAEGDRQAHPSARYTEAPSRGPSVQRPPRAATITPFDFRVAEESRGQLAELNAAANRLHAISGAAEEAEDRREQAFRGHEERRHAQFLQNQDARDREARERAADVWDDLQTRLSALPPPRAELGAPISGRRAEPALSDRESIRAVAAIAASRHASDVLDTVREEREEAQRERQRLATERATMMADLGRAKNLIVEEKDAQIRALEEEIARVREEFNNERQRRAVEQAERREREQQETAERDQFVRNQLGDITNLLQDQQNMIAHGKAEMESRHEEEDEHRIEKDAHLAELDEMIRRIYDDLKAGREISENERRESTEALERVVDELRRQNLEQRELLQSLSESWKADCERHHREIVEAARNTANEQVPYNVQGYLDEFSQALATEVRMLLGEVGRIREERRALQHEIADLRCLKAKYAPGGEHEPDWKPPGQPDHPDPPPGPGPMPDLPPSDPSHIKGAWHPVDPRPKRRKKRAAARTSEPRPVPVPSASARESWATWKTEQGARLTPPLVEPTLGFFGAKTSSESSMYEQRR
ncbi:hypothetical protein HYPSUDRAFT_199905 [Hypholoma sublateritium FD-334 SS-4]|uniref:Uncharacterized protein n=1 Tax=Hypholoma sublateritium (strain FD-334 SS-4) TaxID=945553 RepID=A0A0D2P387_HYPSF|nr:hypothetical protein HYPSUDRAFT_199905 [Hypholoma sublateritium FD-334 SS-4]